MAHDYPMNAFRKMRCGGGDTFLSGPDFDDGEYDLDDFKGCYLVPMTLTQLQVIMNRVKTWRVTVTYLEENLSKSYTFDTPESPNYRFVSGYRKDAGAIDWLKSDGAYGVSTQQVSDERDFNLIEDFRGQSLGFQEVITTDIEKPIRDLQTSFSVGNSAIIGERYVDYYLKDADGVAALTYHGQSEVYATLEFFAWDANPSGLFYLSSMPYDIDFTVTPDRLTNAITITTCEGIVTADVLSEGATTFSFEIEALEYWTYGGKFKSDTGQPA